MMHFEDHHFCIVNFFIFIILGTYLLVQIKNHKNYQLLQLKIKIRALAF